MVAPVVSYRPVTGVVLTGGLSRRFGSPKALAEVEGVAMAVRVATALAAGGCPKVVAVGSVPGLSQIWRPESAAWLGLILEDRWPGEGPLAGVLSAMDGCPGDLVTAACDLAWVDAASVGTILGSVPARESLSSQPQAVYAVTKGQMVPVIWWSEQARPILEAAFDQGERSLRGALRLLNAVAVEISADAARAVTTPEDLEMPHGPLSSP